MRDAARCLQSPTASVGDEIRALDRAEKAIAMAKAERLAEMDATKAHEAEGAASVTVWARREIGHYAGVTRAQVRSVNLTRGLLEVRVAAVQGRLSMRHLQSVAYGVTHCGGGQIAAREPEMVAAATTSTPLDFHERVRQLRYRLFPGDLDKAYLEGMAKTDFKLSKTIGWHGTGFFDIETGAMLDLIQRSLSVPREAGDRRTAAERRMDGWRQLATSVLANGLPTDNGIRPHLSVIVTAETSKAVAAGGAQPLVGELEPAILQGFGPIGRVLLSVLLDDAEITRSWSRTSNPTRKSSTIRCAQRDSRLRCARAQRRVSARSARPAITPSRTTITSTGSPMAAGQPWPTWTAAAANATH